MSAKPGSTPFVGGGRHKRPNPHPVWGGLVRCLGFGPEHVFLSPDRRKVRICQTCRDKQERNRMPREVGGCPQTR